MHAIKARHFIGSMAAKRTSCPFSRLGSAGPPFHSSRQHARHPPWLRRGPTLVLVPSSGAGDDRTRRRDLEERTLESIARDAALIDAALNCAATRGADPADAFWAGYFSRHAGAHARMAHMDEHMRGRMLTSVYDLLLISDADEQWRFLGFEIGNHDAYGAEQGMYDVLFQSLGEALEGACGEQWEQAWAGPGSAEPHICSKR